VNAAARPFESQALMFLFDTSEVGKIFEKNNILILVEEKK
jgi:hypothetical protein